MAATKQRRLSDLYVVGKELVIDDGQGEPITVWIQKLTPLQHEKALRRANGARAGVLAVQREPKDSIDRLSYEHEIESLDSREDMIDYLLTEKLATLYQVEEARLAGEDEWSNENYLQGLTDRWTDGAKDTYAENPDDPEAKRVFEALKEFAEAVEEEVQKHKKSLMRDFEDKTDEELREQVLARAIEMSADLAWLSEYRKCEVWQCVRDGDNHRELYFHHRDEVDELSIETFKLLSEAYNELKVDIIEGKDSEETPTS